MTDKPFHIINVETGRDARGWVSNLLDFLPLPAEQIKNIHVVELKPGAVRGNHRHRRQREWFLICGGPCRLAVEIDGQRTEQTIAGDRPVLVSVAPGTAHALRYEGETVAYLTAVTDAVYNPRQPDLERVILLE